MTLAQMNRPRRRMPAVLVALLLLAICVGPATQAQGRRYYLAPDGSDEAAGTSAQQPWRTLARAQRAFDEGAIGPGDELLLARGGQFPGALTIAGRHGAAGAPIRIGAYGDGPAPVISGVAALTDWADLGGGRWRAACGPCAVLPRLLLLDGAAQPLARWPNADGPAGGYRFYQSFAGRRSITDAGLAGGPGWVGGELALRTHAWIIDRLPIVGQQGGTLTLGADASYPIIPGFGYFIQNHPDALDRHGEWVYDPATRQVTIWLDTPPSAHQIAVSVVADVLNIHDSSHLQLHDLHIQGGDAVNLSVQRSQDLTIERVVSADAGDQGVELLQSQRVTLRDSSIRDALNHGLRAIDCVECVVEENTITRVALLAGMGQGGDGQYNAVQFGGQGAVFQRNQVREAGYLGVDLRGPALVRHNLVAGFNRVKIDGGGIYTYQNRDVQIVENIVLDGRGSPAGTPWAGAATHGIYIDDNAEQVEVRGNTVAHVSSGGVYLHNTRAVTVTGNTILAAGEAGIILADDDLGSYAVEQSLISGNLVVADAAPVISATTNGGPGFFAALGAIDGNRYCAPFADPWVAHGYQGLPPGAGRLSLGAWSAGYGHDGASQRCAYRSPTMQVIAERGASLVGNGGFERTIEGWFGWPDDTLDARWASGRLDGGSLYVGHNGPGELVHIDYPIGPVAAGAIFRLRVDLLSDAPDRAITAYLRQSGPPYALVSDALTLPLGSARQGHEVFLQVSAGEADTLLIFELRKPNLAAWLDNVALQPVAATPIRFAEIVRLEYNAGPTPRSLRLDGYNWVDPAGAAYPAYSTLTIPPYGSRILLREGFTGDRAALPVVVR